MILAKDHSACWPDPTNLVERLQYWAAENPDDLAFIHLPDGDGVERTWSYAELDRRARGVAARLRDDGLAGERLLLLYPSGLDFIAALMGCFYSGSVAIPVFPPRRNRNMTRLQAIAADSGAAGALTTTDIIERTGRLSSDLPEFRSLPWIATDDPAREDASSSRIWQPVRAPAADQLAVLQYTSGSTGTPKGVMLTHGNLWHNCRVIEQAFGAHRNDMAMSWLPTYHDMGLIGGILTPIAIGLRTLLMSPMAFLQCPVRWLRSISAKRVSISGGPNFAYDHCTNQITDEELAGLDLSSWQVAYNGAEPIRESTIREFSHRFGPVGFRREAFYPCYGMAESTLLISGGVRGRLPVVNPFHGKRLDDGCAETTPPQSPASKLLVSSGRPQAETTVVVVHPDEQRPVGEQGVGEIWVHSPSVGQGYLNHDPTNAAIFRATLPGYPGKHFLRTGDLGFQRDGELYITGRIKDLIIIRGVNHYPQDIEMTVEQSSRHIKRSATAAFAIERQGREQLAVVCEVERVGEVDWSAVMQTIRRQVAVVHDVTLDAVVLLRVGSIPKTSSGKIQRKACREKFMAGELLVVAQWGVDEATHSPTNDERCSGNCNRRVTTHEAHAPLGRPLASPAESDDSLAPILARVYAAVLEVARDRAGLLGPDTNIRELGLDSLERAQIARQLVRTHAGHLQEEALFECETCREVAQVIVRHSNMEPQTLPAGEIPSAWYDIGQWPEYLQLKQTMAWMQSARLPNPYFQVHQGVASATTRIAGRELINFSSYNYLGMSGDPMVTRAAQIAMERFGTSASASRLVSGERPVHGDLERELAHFLGTEGALAFVGGHATNETTIGHLMAAGDLVLHDELAHNSILQGAVLSGAHRRHFPHNDWRTLDRMLRELRRDYRRVLIVLEGVYSMDGDFPDLPRFVELKYRHRALLMVDEAHSIGTMGATGRGICEHWGIRGTEIDVLMGTLSKALGSCGGYIAGRSELIEFMRYTAPGFVYSVGLSPANAAAALASLRLLQEQPERVERCQARAQFFLRQAKQLGLNTGTSGWSPVVPVIVGNSRHALRLSRRLFERGINVQPILYPAVEERAARLRFFITSEHLETQIRQAVELVAEELHRIEGANLPLPHSPVELSADSPAQEGAA